jgi:hypothetical protein
MNDHMRTYSITARINRLGEMNYQYGGRDQSSQTEKETIQTGLAALIGEIPGAGSITLKIKINNNKL